MSDRLVAFIGLGSNLDDPHRQLSRARLSLASLPGSRLRDSSPIYRSAPMGPRDQPDYLNAVVVLETVLGPHELLRELQSIEQQHGRVRRRHWGERTLDLDILLYGSEQIGDPVLTVPHPGIGQREFVLYPLADLAPDLDIPGLGAVQSLRDRVEAQGLQRTDLVWLDAG
ncbi:2-amino-4-hydroxy-6-hydroxymethyldihydropteridine diphosphokinase [Methylonatrum kenyense]|uniref:2-amino-4-hydroxy-6- hydroxymethyldihydropteridine diphosphokinase n=1 Tax=Methylonatrum kenyense TaxID=455253 RepID=UPI0020BECF0E|nr:2-amino-4-hydroxy-6-hydroxymethyldihydropteridine diphosphokinase [Methylonatrum kenyense]MCK8516109.1 2-amino-4-hydroxy-6-hydroxymethyldihydropteridine diphosphokinase [Methylonatrum kenyense]